MTARARRIRDLASPLGVPRESARFAGRWIGKWEAQLEHVLVVELVVQNEQTTEVLAVYSWESRRRSV